MAKNKRDKQKEEYREREFHQSRKKLADEHTVGGFIYRLTEHIRAGDPRRFEFTATCPVDDCGVPIRADDATREHAHVMLRNRIDNHFKDEHRKG